VSHQKPKLITISGFFDETGIDRRTTGKYIREAGLKPVKVDGKSEWYDRGELLRITEKLFKTKTEGESSLKDQKTLEEIRKLRIANDEKERKNIPRSEVAKRDSIFADRFKSRMYSVFVDQLPAVMTNDVTTNRALSRREVDGFLSDVSTWCKGLKV
jgi:hypothetical protein